MYRHLTWYLVRSMDGLWPMYNVRCTNVYGLNPASACKNAQAKITDDVYIRHHFMGSDYNLC